LTIIDPHLKKESRKDKYAILDVKLHTVSGSIIHIEIQRLSDFSDNRCYPSRNNIRVGMKKQVKIAV